MEEIFATSIAGRRVMGMGIPKRPTLALSG